MYPSKVIFEQSKEIIAGNFSGLMEICVNEVYSAMQSMEELIAALESRMQSKINADPGKFLAEESLYGIPPRKVLLKIDESEFQNLSNIIETKGKCLKFISKIEYEEVHLVGFMDNKYMIANTEINLWSDYAEIIYIPSEPGLSIRKMRFIE